MWVWYSRVTVPGRRNWQIKNHSLEFGRFLALYLGAQQADGALSASSFHSQYARVRTEFPQYSQKHSSSLLPPLPPSSLLLG